jgi:MFS family permease
VFASICALSALVNFGRVAFAPLVDVFVRSGVAPSTAGLAATAVWIGTALPRLPTGYLLTVVRRQRVVIGMGVGLSGAAAFTALSPGIWTTIAGALLVGLASGVFFIAANPLVSELYPDRVGRALGIRGMFSQIAAVGAPFLVAAAIALGTWRIAFGALAAGVLAVTGAFAIATNRTGIPGVDAADSDLVGAIRTEWSLIAAGIAFVGVAGFVWQGVFNFYITYLGTKGIPSGAASTLLTLTFAAGVPSFALAGRLADHLPYRLLLHGILAGFVTCLLAFTTVESVAAVAVVSVLMGLVVHALFPVADAYLLDTVTDGTRSSAYAGYSATMMLLQAPGSVAVGVFADAGVPYTRTFRWLAAAVAVVAVGLALLDRDGRLPAA